MNVKLCRGDGPTGPTAPQIEQQTGLGRLGLLESNPQLGDLYKTRITRSGGRIVGVTPHLVQPIYLVDMPPGKGTVYTFHSPVDLRNVYTGFDESKGRFDQVCRELMTYAECHLTSEVRHSVPLMLRGSQIAANQAGVYTSPPPLHHGNPCPPGKHKGASLAELQMLPIDWSRWYANDAQCLVDINGRVDELELGKVGYPNSGVYCSQLRAMGHLTVSNEDAKVKARPSNGALEATFSTLGANLPLLRTPTHVDVAPTQYIPCPETTRVERQQCVRFFDTPYFAKETMLYLPEETPLSAWCKEVGIFRHLVFRSIDLYLVILYDDKFKIQVVSPSGPIPPAEAYPIEHGLRLTRPVPEVYPPPSKKKRKAGGGAASSLASPRKKARAETLDREREHTQLMADGGGGSNAPASGTPQQQQARPDYVTTDTELTSQHAIAASIGQQHSHSSNIPHSTATAGSSGGGDSRTDSPVWRLLDSPRDSPRGQAGPSVDDLVEDDSLGTAAAKETNSDDTNEFNTNDLFDWLTEQRRSSSNT